jgi:hypothetical protein
LGANGWEVSNVVRGGYVSACSLAVDQLGRPHIAYCDYGGGGNLSYLYAPPPPLLALAPTLLSDGQFCFQLTGEPGLTALIQASPDLEHWTTLGSCVLSDQPVLFTDPQSALFPRRFYRLVLPYGAPWPEECRWAGGQITFNPVGLPGGTVVIEASTNLVNWTPIATNVLGSTPTPFSDPQSAQFSRRFYRLLKP